MPPAALLLVLFAVGAAADFAAERHAQENLAVLKRAVDPPWQEPVAPKQVKETHTRVRMRPPADSPTDLPEWGVHSAGKTAVVLLSGQLRTLEFVAPFILRNVVRPYNASLFACIVPEHQTKHFVVEGSHKKRKVGDILHFAGDSSSVAEEHFAQFDKHLGRHAHVLDRVMVEFPEGYAKVDKPYVKHLPTKSLFSVMPKGYESATDGVGYNFRFPMDWDTETGEVAAWSLTARELMGHRHKTMLDYFFEARLASHQCQVAFTEYRTRHSMDVDWVVRQRFDIAPFDKLPDLASIREDAIHVPRGNDYGGILDRMAMGPPELMEIYFNSLLFSVQAGKIKDKWVTMPTWNDLLEGKYELPKSVSPFPCIRSKPVETELLCQLAMYRPAIVRYQMPLCTVRPQLVKGGHGAIEPTCDKAVHGVNLGRGIPRFWFSDWLQKVARGEKVPGIPQAIHLATR